MKNHTVTLTFQTALAALVCI